jgi:hypothetical protein
MTIVAQTANAISYGRASAFLLRCTFRHLQSLTERVIVHFEYGCSKDR